ncbi:MAG: hypothetical protein US31_C0016G0012 [Berkelbacteria bacterium GW2011_GWA1_36_9]|uniref:Transglutaminase-like domain-containing protein n=1 Tax=Berkelbacteria bacterium GW2011_GWA1_36_9 TaxID=1618331 RepID=A0A0G0FVF3_9BACT|nr:MAG: hypothetical protein US31_C0016G0012 [Berkelbacteria bacterium GW2011_GWA1_36_9]
MENIEDFLKETGFCDFSDKSIQALAGEIAKNCKNDREFAVSAFYWVRDNILYRVGDWQRKATETLIEREGACTSKANLLVGLLRWRDIPAGYGIMKVYGRKYLGPIAGPMFQKFIGRLSTHVYAIVFLDGKWIKCDPSDDKEFCDNTNYFNSTTRLTEWDGFRDATLNLDKNDIINDNYPISNIDSWMGKRARNAKGIPLKVANLYVKFARKNKIKVSNVKELENLFKKNLKKEYAFYFYLFMFFSYLKIISQKLFKNEKNS